MGAVTTSILSGLSIGGAYKHALVTFTPSSSYATGGDDVASGDIPFATVTAFIGEPRTFTNGYSVALNPSTLKLKAFGADGTEIANGTNLSAVTFTGYLIGR